MSSRGVTRACEADDNEYLREMREILEAYPLTGPPEFAVRLAPNLYIGNQKNADDIAGLKRLDITYVLNCAGSRRLDFKRVPYPRCARVDAYLAIPAEDRVDYDIMQHFIEVFGFIDKARRRGANVLVHCNLGINRSGVICAAYLMANQHMYLLEVIKLLKAKRSVVLWNKGFRLQLIKFARSRGYLDPRHQSVPSSVGGFRQSSSSSALNSMATERRQYGGGKTPPCERAKRASDRKDPKEEKQGNGSLLAASLRRSFRSRLATSLLAKHSSFGSSRESAERDSSRFAMAYLTVPRQVRRTPKEKENKSATLKRPILSSHYESDYFMDSIYGSNHVTSSAPVFRQTRSVNDHNDVNTSGRSSRPDATTSRPGGAESSTLSTTRPLRVYRKAATDTQIYVKPTSSYIYRRSETVATDMTHEFGRLQLDEGSREQRRDHSYESTPATKEGGRYGSVNALSSRHMSDMTHTTN